MKIIIISVLFMSLMPSLRAEVFALRISQWCTDPEYYLAEFFNIDAEKSELNAVVPEGKTHEFGIELARNHSSGAITFNGKNFSFSSNIFLLREGYFVQKWDKIKMFNEVDYDVLVQGTLRKCAESDDIYIDNFEYGLDFRSPVGCRVKLVGSRIMKPGETVIFIPRQ